MPEVKSVIVKNEEDFSKVLIRQLRSLSVADLMCRAIATGSAGSSMFVGATTKPGSTKEEILKESRANPICAVFVCVDPDLAQKFGEVFESLVSEYNAASGACTCDKCTKARAEATEKLH